jgi:hypothetical protein
MIGARYYIDYLENICKLLKEIGHSADKRKFYRSIDEFTGTQLEYPVVIYVPQGSPILTLGGDNYIKNRTIELWILKGCTIDSFEEQQDILDFTEEIARKIITRIKHDVEDYSSGPANRLLKGFDLNHIPMDDINYRGGEENCFGTRMGLNLKNPIKLDYDENDWLEEE